MKRLVNITCLHLVFMVILSSAAFSANHPNHKTQDGKDKSSILERKKLSAANRFETNSIFLSSEEDQNATINPPPNPKSSNPNGIKPIVLWHGMGDTAVGVKFALRFISQEIPGVYIKSLQFGANPAEDFESGYFINANDQVAMACETIRNDSNLQNGYNAVGLSQGGQFLRALAQRCPDPPMLSLISFGGQHQGIYGVPKCSAASSSICAMIDKLLTNAAYAGWVQKFLVQAEYWHDPNREEEYRENSIFLADINNERVKNATYKKNLLKLKNLVLVKFLNETIVQPKESEWFGYFESGQLMKMVKLEDSALYKEDWLGLKVMNEAGRLHFLSVEGDHLQFTKQWFIDNIMRPFLM